VGEKLGNKKLSFSVDEAKTVSGTVL